VLRAFRRARAFVGFVLVSELSVFGIGFMKQINLKMQVLPVVWPVVRITSLLTAVVPARADDDDAGGVTNRIKRPIEEGKCSSAGSRRRIDGAPSTRNDGNRRSV
jgi:hypothetical protein